MEEVKIKIGDKEYLCKLAVTEEEHEQGLQGVTNLPENEGMLFLFEEPDEISIWLKDTPIPLDVVFINDSLEVISVHQGIPNSEELMTEQDVKYVLEVSQNSGILPNEDMEFVTNKKLALKKDKMSVLDENGNVQMELEGGERIFSIKNTKTLIKIAKRAYSTKKDSDYKTLGKKALEYIEIQDKNKPEFVEK